MDGVPGTTAIATYFGDAVPLVSQLLGAALQYHLLRLLVRAAHGGRAAG